MDDAGSWGSEGNSRDVAAPARVTTSDSEPKRRRVVITPPRLLRPRYIGPFERERFLNVLIPVAAVAFGAWLAWMGPWLIDPY